MIPGRPPSPARDHGALGRQQRHPPPGRPAGPVQPVTSELAVTRPAVTRPAAPFESVPGVAEIAGQPELTGEPVPRHAPVPSGPLAPRGPGTRPRAAPAARCRAPDPVPVEADQAPRGGLH